MNEDSKVFSLASSIFHGPRQYALLLGSGVSSGAGVPTGWQVTLDLIRRLPGAPASAPDNELESWYESSFGKKPAYSEVIASLATSTSDRRNLLQSYFEPNTDEQELGLKVPSAAHLAIAELISRGLIRIVITTNFDRLLEDALASKGIHPDVVFHESMIDGAMPPIHSGAFILKIHGDYLDSRLLNTESELEDYSPRLKAMLGRILDDHGLVICGWSGDYDPGLVNALLESPNRRHATYWLHQEPLRGAAKLVVENRCAETIKIESADLCFAKILQYCESHASLNSRNGTESEVLVETTKRFIAQPEMQIRLWDLLNVEARRLHGLCSAEGFPAQLRPPTADEEAYLSYREQVSRIESICERLCLMALVIGYHGSERHILEFLRAIEPLGRKFDQNRAHPQHHIGNYPVLLATYSLGVGAVANDKFGNVATLLKSATFDLDGVKTLLAPELRIEQTLGNVWANALAIDCFEPTFKTKYYSPGANHLLRVIAQWAECIFLDEAGSANCFDKFHYARQLVWWDHDVEGGEQRPWIEIGRGTKLSSRSIWDRSPQKQFHDALASHGADNPLLRAGFFKSDIGHFDSRSGHLVDSLIERARNMEY